MLFAINKTKLRSICSTLVHQRYIHCTADSSKPSLRFIQFQRPNSHLSRLGVVSEDGKNFIDLSAQSLFPHKLTHLLQSKYCIIELEKSLEKLSSEEVTDNVQILSPITRPEKVLAIGPDPKSLPVEDGCWIPSCNFQSIITSKLPSSLTGPTGSIVLPRGAVEIECRTGLAVVMGKDAKCVAANVVNDHIFGYTIGMHVHVSKFDNSNQNLSDQALIGHSSDTFCPLGPTVVHKSLISPDKLTTTLRVNDSPEQLDGTCDLVSSIPETIEFITQFFTLRAGDVILTGSPCELSHMQRCGIATAKAGDTIHCEIEGIGKLRNDVVADEK